MAVTINGTTGISTTGDYDAEDGDKILLGTSDDLQIYHNGTDSVIQEAVNNRRFLIAGDEIVIRKGDLSEDLAKFNADGACELYHNNVKTFFTDTYGAVVVAPEGGAAELHIWADEGDDNNDKFMINTYDGRLRVQNYTSGSWETNIECNGNGNVELYYDGGTAKFETTSDGIFVNGKIAVGTNASNNTINVSGAAGSGQTTLYYGFGTIDLTSASDERVKNNIVPTAKGLKEILELPIVDFTYLPEYSDDSTTVRTGGIAQEWQKIDTNLVNDENKDLLFIKYKETIPLLIKAVQELSAEVDTLKTEKTKLQTDLTALTARVAALEAA